VSLAGDSIAALTALTRLTRLQVSSPNLALNVISKPSPLSHPHPNQKTPVLALSLIRTISLVLARRSRSTLFMGHSCVHRKSRTGVIMIGGPRFTAPHA